MKPFIPFLSYLSFLLACVAPSTAQEEPPVVPFQVYLWPGGAPPGIKTQVAGDEPSMTTDSSGMMMKNYEAPVIKYCPEGMGDSMLINAAERRISPIYHYQGANPLVFFQEDTGPGGETVRHPIASVHLEPGIERALLLFYPRKADSKYDIMVIDNSIQHIRAGKALVYNLSSTPVACLFNDQQLMLNSGQSDFADLGPVANFTATIRIGSEDDKGRWRERYAERLVVDPEDSVLAFIYTKPKRQRDYRILVLKNPDERSVPEAHIEPSESL